MKNLKAKSRSRRNFLKGALLNGAALSAIPLGSYGHSITEISDNSMEDLIPRLPLKIMMRSGLPDRFKQKIRDISPKITFLENSDENPSDNAIEQAQAWFGYIGKEEFVKAKSLKWVQSPSAGVFYYLYPEFVESNVVLTNAKGCYGPAIGEHTIGLLFSLTRKLASQTRNMSAGKWQGEDNMIEMKDLTMGIIGLGGIGSQVARRARGMDMKVIAVDIIPKYTEQIGDICDEVRLVQDQGLEWLLPQSDVVVSAVPHTNVSEGMLGAEQFTMMKNGAYLINVSRGKIVQTNALIDALKSGHLAGAGLDVTDPEPLPADHELWRLPNVIITSHIAARSQHSGNRLNEVFVENVHRYVNGFPLLNQVDKVMGF